MKINQTMDPLTIYTKWKTLSELYNEHITKPIHENKSYVEHYIWGDDDIYYIIDEYYSSDEDYYSSVDDDDSSEEDDSSEDKDSSEEDYYSEEDDYSEVCF